MIRMLSASCSASSIECVVSNTLLLPLNDFIAPHIDLLASGSMPVLGSSNKRVVGEPIIATATINFLLLPPDYNPAAISLPPCMFSLPNSYSFCSCLLLTPTPLISLYRSICSFPLSSSSTDMCCGHYPMERLTLSTSLITSIPPTFMLPAEEMSSPVMHLNSVDLPAPFVPSNTKHSRSRKLNDMLETE